MKSLKEIEIERKAALEAWGREIERERQEQTCYWCEAPLGPVQCEYWRICTGCGFHAYFGPPA